MSNFNQDAFKQSIESMGTDHLYQTEDRLEEAVKTSHVNNIVGDIKLRLVRAEIIRRGKLKNVTSK